MRILFFPIEPLEERYSADWYIWFIEEFVNQGIDFHIFNPIPLSDKITSGSFLDVCGTNWYKSIQIKQFSEFVYKGNIEDDDVVFLMDAWFPGLESIAYIRDALNLKFKICGILHAGTYDPYDFLTKKGMDYWGKSLEESWFKILDKVFVATKFHKQLLLRTRNINPKKIVVTGLPTMLNPPPDNTNKENIIVFPHRLDSEKNPEMFSLLKESYLGKVLREAGWTFIFSKKNTESKSEYYNLLWRSKISVSFADQETFGIAMIESVMDGCFPVVPNRLSYTELYHPVFQYHSLNEAMLLIQKIVNHPEDFGVEFEKTRSKLYRITHQAIPNMIEEMRRL
jgi:glycosyltransferase involved in cell wall biosynthesis